MRFRFALRNQLGAFFRNIADFLEMAGGSDDLEPMPRRGLLFEPLTEENLPEPLWTGEESSTEPWTRESLRRVIKDKSSCFIAATRDEQIVGYGGFILSNGLAHILAVAVRPDLRNRRIGRRIVGRLLREARIRKAEGAFLEVRESNLFAQKLYRVCGFRAIFMENSFYTDTREAAIVMQRKL